MGDGNIKAQQSVALLDSDSLRLCSCPELHWFSDKRGAIVFDSKTRDAHVLSARASYLLLLCDGTRDLMSVLDAASDIKVTDENQNLIEKDIAWIKRARKKGLIVVTQSASSPVKKISGKQLGKIAVSLLNSGEPEAAKRCAGQLARKVPSKPKYWSLLGDAEHALGNYKAARKAYKRYLELKPDDLGISHLVTALSGGTPPSRASVEYVKQTFDDYAETFDQSLVNDLGYRTPELIVKALKKVPPGLRQKKPQVADLGCGTGLMGAAISSWAGSICGVDLSRNMLSKAILNGHYDEIHVADITKWLASSTGTFDLILSADVLVYFGDLQDVFSLVRRRLGCGSVFCFSVELGGNPGFDLTVSGRYAHHPKYIRKVAKKAGFKVCSLTAKTLRYEYGKEVAGLIVVLCGK